MTEKEAEEIVGNLVVHGGIARSSCLEAIKCARQGDFEKADELMSEAQAELNQAHNYQTAQITKEMSGEGTDNTPLLMVHGQDHLMCAMVVYDLANQMIGILKDSSK